MVALRTIFVLTVLSMVSLAFSGKSTAMAAEPSVLLFESQSIYVIVHPDVPLETLDDDELRSILLGKKRYWSGGEAIRLIINSNPDNIARRFWLEDVIEMSEIQYTQYWVGMVFRGRALNAPHVVPDSQTAMALVAALPGSISLIEIPPEYKVRALVVEAPSKGAHNDD